MKSLQQMESLAGTHGLVVRGAFTIEHDDGVPPISIRTPSQSLVLFGNAGSSMWKTFSSSTEYADGCPDVLDRWSRRISGEMAKLFEGRALFPFDGPPHYPFLRWAKKAEGLQNSRLGMLMHPQYGLWHAYRFAIALPWKVEFNPVDSVDICSQCPDQPCVAACPANAFDRQFDSKACYDHLSSDQNTSCRSACRARLSCPYAARFRYHPEQARFHMDAYIRTMSKRL